MKKISYLNLSLTVIAVCLIKIAFWSEFGSIIPQAQAAAPKAAPKEDYTKVVIVGYQHSGVFGTTLRTDLNVYPLPVSVMEKR